MRGNPIDACRVPDGDLEDKCSKHGGHHHGRHELGAPAEPLYDQVTMVRHDLMLLVAECIDFLQQPFRPRGG